MAAFSAVIDADCLHKIHLRNSLLQLATAGFYRPRWSNQILEELERSLRRRGVVSEVNIYSLVYRLGEIYPDSVISKYEHLIGTLGCPDPNDEHVLAAAVIEKAGAIVTCNIKDFPSNSFETFGIEIVHPDDFLMDQVDLNPEVVLTQIASQIESYSRPESDALQFSNYMEKASCFQFGKFIFEHRQFVDATIKQLRIASGGLRAAD